MKYKYEAFITALISHDSFLLRPQNGFLYSKNPFGVQLQCEQCGWISGVLPIRFRKKIKEACGHCVNREGSCKISKVENLSTLKNGEEELIMVLETEGLQLVNVDFSGFSWVLVTGGRQTTSLSFQLDATGQSAVEVTGKQITVTVLSHVAYIERIYE